MKKSKLFLSIVSLCFSLAVLCFGVYAVNQVNYQISGSISYDVQDCYVEINTSIYSSPILTLQGIHTNEQDVDGMYDKIDNIIDDDFTGLSAVSVSSLAYNSLSDDVSSASKNLNLQFSGGNNSQLAYFVVMKVKNLGDNVIWANAGELPTLPNNVYSINSGLQTEIQKNEIKTMVIALSVMDVTKEITAPAQQNATNYSINLHIESGEYVLMDYIDFEDGEISCSDTSIGSEFEELIIPSYIDEQRVTTLGDFSQCEDVTSFYVPNSVTLMQQNCIAGCNDLESLTVPFVGKKDYISQEAVVEEEDGYYMHATMYWWFGENYGGNLVYSDIMDEVYENMYCYIPSNWTNLEILYGCHILPNWSFNDGNGDVVPLESVSLPYGITYMGSAFAANAYLYDINIPNSVIEISATFQGCTSLIEITIPSSVIIIDEFAFNYTSITEITIPSSVTKIGAGVFSYSCLESIIFESGSKLSIIGDEAFACISMSTITIPVNVKLVGEYVFSGCSSLTTINVHWNGGSKPAGWDNYWKGDCSATVIDLDA